MNSLRHQRVGGRRRIIRYGLPANGEGDKSEEEQEKDLDSEESDLNDFPYKGVPSTTDVRTLEYVRKMQHDFICLQKSFLALTTHFARLQFRLRQIIAASPGERDNLLLELEKMAFDRADNWNRSDEMPYKQCDLQCIGDVRRKQHHIIKKLRSQLTNMYEAVMHEVDVTCTTDDLKIIDMQAEASAKRASRRRQLK